MKNLFPLLTAAIGSAQKEIIIPYTGSLIEHPDFRVSAIIMLIGVIFSVTLHEIAHAYMAHWMGDPTPEEHGRLTLNPIPHFKSAIFMMLILPLISWFQAGGWWAMAGGFCPVNPKRMRDEHLGDFLTSIAGPGVMLIISFVCAILLMIPAVGALGPDPMSPAAFGLLLVGQANLFLAVFNLLPIPPLDGAHAFGALVPGFAPIIRKADGSIGMILVVLVGWRIMDALSVPLFRFYISFIESGAMIFG